MARQGEPFDEIMIVNPYSQQGGKRMRFYPITPTPHFGYVMEAPEQMGYFAEVPEQMGYVYEAPETDGLLRRRTGNDGLCVRGSRADGIRLPIRGWLYR